jgi:hypothetical protein
MRTYEYLKNFVSFTSSIDDTRIETVKNLINLHLSIQGAMTAASAVGPETFVDVINPFELKVGAVPKIRLTGLELLAFNMLFLKRDPVMMRAGATTNDITRINDLVIPVNYAAPIPVLYYNITRTAVSGVGSERLTLVAELSDAAPAERPIQALKYSYTPPATGSMYKALERVLAGDLEAILLYSTTVPSDSADTSTIDSVELYVGGDLVTRTREMHIYRPRPYIEDADGTPTARILNKWMLLDFRPEPIPAGSSIRLDIQSDDTNAIRIIPIERLPA